MLYNPKSKTFLKDITSGIEEYGSYRPRKVDKEKVFKYICLMYDKDSPLSYEITDYYQKKSSVAEMVGFDKGEDDYYTQEYEDILTGKDERVNGFAATYLSKQALPLWQQLMAYKEMLSNETRKALSHRAGKDTIANIEKLTERIKEIERELMQSGKTNELIEVRKAIYAQLERDKQKIRPEQIVKLVEKEEALPKEFDQYPEEGVKKVTPIGNSDMHFYQESEEEREERKRDERELTK